MFVRFKIPRECVKDFILQNKFQYSDRTSLNSYKDAIAPDMQVLPPTDRRFYLKGRTKFQAPFEILVDETGQVIAVVATPD